VAGRNVSTAHTHTHTSVFYVCVCVCMCVCNASKIILSSSAPNALHRHGEMLFFPPQVKPVENPNGPAIWGDDRNQVQEVAESSDPDGPEVSRSSQHTISRHRPTVFVYTGVCV
jgi:hypothetical protein